MTHHTSNITHHTSHCIHKHLASSASQHRHTPCQPVPELKFSRLVPYSNDCIVCSQIRLTLSETNLAKMNIITATEVLVPGPASTSTPAQLRSHRWKISQINYICMNNVKAKAPIPQPKLGWTEKIIDLGTSSSSQGLSEVRRGSGFYSSQLSGNSRSWGRCRPSIVED